MSLTGKIAIVTGASRGIGEAIARAAIEAGAKVVLASRKQADLDRVAGALPSDRVLAVACHTGKSEDVEALFAKALDKFGRVDGAVNNAATATVHNSGAGRKTQSSFISRVTRK